MSSHIAFINGGVNFKSFASKEHATSDCHKMDLEEAKHEQPIEANHQWIVATKACHVKTKQTVQ